MPDRSPLYPKQVLEPGPEQGRVRRAGSSVGMVLDAWRRRPGFRRLVAVLSVLAFLAGVGLFSYPFLTNVYADWKQSQLADDFATPEHRQAYVTRTIRAGEALTRIVIPKLDVDAYVVEGVELDVLRAGAGHYPSTALPCENGNVAIAGHRTTYSKPFAHIDRLSRGDRVVLVTPLGRCVYEVSTRPWITAPNDVAVLDQGSGALLTLTTCNPPGSAVERLVVRANLVGSNVDTA